MAITETKNNGGALGFEAELFKAADKLRGNMELSDYKHVALGLIFLKHIEPPRVYRRLICSNIRRPYRVYLVFHRTPPLLLRVGYTR